MSLKKSQSSQTDHKVIHD